QGTQGPGQRQALDGELEVAAQAVAPRESRQVAWRGPRRPLRARVVRPWRPRRHDDAAFLAPSTQERDRFLQFLQQRDRLERLFHGGDLVDLVLALGRTRQQQPDLQLDDLGEPRQGLGGDLQVGGGVVLEVRQEGPHERQAVEPFGFERTQAQRVRQLEKAAAEVLLLDQEGVRLRRAVTHGASVPRPRDASWTGSARWPESLSRGTGRRLRP